MKSHQFHHLHALLSIAAASVILAAGAGAQLSLLTTYAEGNGQDGAMFDLTCSDPNGITITSFDFNARTGTQGMPADIEVYYVTDHTTYQSKNADPSLWTLLGSAHLNDVNATGTPTHVEIGGLTINNGETCGLYFTRSDTLSLGYTNGPLGQFTGPGLTFEDRGLGVVYPFGSSFTPRIWNGTIYYNSGGGGGSYALDLSGTCPGTVTLSWRGATPHIEHAVVFGANQGNTVIPHGHPCAGTALGLAGSLRVINRFDTRDGSGSVNGNADAGACGHYLQLIEEGTCNTSNVAQIP